MFSALFYLQFHTLKNRLLERLRRLRRPRYLFGAVAGGLYLVMVLTRPFSISPQGHGGVSAKFMPEIPENVWEFVVALALAVLAALAWLLPNERAALVFSEAEIAFLFPAPIRRQTLIHYKLARSQLALVFTGSFFLLFLGRRGGFDGALMRVAGAWIALSTINLHLLGASFMRTLLVDRGISTWRRRGLILVVLLAIAAGALWWARGQVPVLGPADTASLKAFASYLGKVAETPPAHWLLLPFRVIIRPFLAASSTQAGAFAAAVWPALGLLALHYLWVVRSDVAFEEASITASQRHAVRVAAMRSGNWQNARPARKRRAPFRLAPTGSPAVAILWKNLLGAGQFFNARLGIGILIWAGVAGMTVGSAGRGHTEWPLVAAWICLMLLGMALLFGPQLVRQDFRRDLAVADLLKIYPLRGWQVALGELLAPTVILTAIEWGLIVLAVSLSASGTANPANPANPARPEVAIAAGVAVAVLCPTFNLVSLFIPNAAALLLPAWFATSNTPGATANSRGIEVVGQRLIVLLAQTAALVLALLPAGLVFFLVYELATKPYLPEAAALPLSACAATLTLAAEAVGGIALLGGWFEGYDVGEERV